MTCRCGVQHDAELNRIIRQRQRLRDAEATIDEALPGCTPQHREQLEKAIAILREVRDGIADA